MCQANMACRLVPVAGRRVPSISVKKHSRERSEAYIRGHDNKVKCLSSKSSERMLVKVSNEIEKTPLDLLTF